MKKLLGLSCMLLLSSCGFSLENYIVGTNYGSENWGIRNFDHREYITGIENTYREIFVQVQLKEAGYVKSTNPIPSLSSYVNDCTTRTDKTISVDIYNLRSYYKDHKVELKNAYTFDASKVYLIKNGQKYYPELQQDVPKIYDVNMVLTHAPYMHLVYSAPLICGELEDAVIVVDGISSNKKPLEPLMIKFNYLTPTEVPLYGGSK